MSEAKAKGKKTLGSKLAVMHCLHELVEKGLQEIGKLPPEAWAAIDALEFEAESGRVKYTMSAKVIEGGGK